MLEALRDFHESDKSAQCVVGYGHSDVAKHVSARQQEPEIHIHGVTTLPYEAESEA